MGQRRDRMAERLRGMEWRVERLATPRQVEIAFAEFCHLQEYFLHSDHNDEPLRILDTVRSNIAWSRAQRRFIRANTLARRKLYDRARSEWREGLAMLAHDWSVMYRREPVPVVDEPMWFDDS